MLRILDSSEDRLRAQVITYNMCNHLENYQPLPIEAISGDMPTLLKYSSIDDIIAD